MSGVAVQLLLHSPDGALFRAVFSDTLEALRPQLHSSAAGFEDARAGRSYGLPLSLYEKSCVPGIQQVCLPPARTLRCLFDSMSFAVPLCHIEDMPPCSQLGPLRYPSITHNNVRRFRSATCWRRLSIPCRFRSSTSSCRHGSGVRTAWTHICVTSAGARGLRAERPGLKVAQLVVIIREDAVHGQVSSCGLSGAWRCGLPWGYRHRC